MGNLYGKLSVTVVLMNDRGQVLGSKRRDSDEVGLPGGSVEEQDAKAMREHGPRFRSTIDTVGVHIHQETGIMSVARHAARRELLEETGMDLDFRDDLYREPVSIGVCVDESGAGQETIAFAFVAKGRYSADCEFPPIPGEPEALWVDWSDLMRGPFGRRNTEVFQAMCREYPQLMEQT